MDHLIRECPLSVSMWTELAIPNLLQETSLEFLQWLTWVFAQNAYFHCRLFCCAIWATWGERNARLHEKTSRTGIETAHFVRSYIAELDGVEQKTPKILQIARKWKHPPEQSVKINFDGAYDARLCQSALGVVARNSEGDVLLSSSKIHQGISSAFAAKALACRKVD
ncbi:hypothetical protein GOBAR_AA16881 [Gossypium barbadense]|uniref:RNase H type-1 domain-containing protein n=1 Tax=Gossypium barbadense TaxID=3634 RepID=A0A2P5XKA4_GOSBA|nr:hypothetical protein GOBAR_AA16881 [Gossypium barbadense]